MGKKDKGQMKMPEVEKSAPQQELLEFDVWHVMRSPKIPQHHMKEIIKADFRARGLSEKESMEVFDKALSDYGVKL